MHLAVFFSSALHKAVVSHLPLQAPFRASAGFVNPNVVFRPALFRLRVNKYPGEAAEEV